MLQLSFSAKTSEALWCPLDFPHLSTWESYGNFQKTASLVLPILLLVSFLLGLRRSLKALVDYPISSPAHFS